MNMKEFEIRKTIEVFKNNELVEVRIIGNGNKIYSGYFKSIDNLISEVSKYEQYGNVYFIFNKLKEECYHREQCEKIVFGARSTTDTDIEGREWLMIDVDGNRVAGISSTDEEKAEVRKVALNTYQYLKDFGFAEPVSADSGNGYHLMYKIKLQNSKEVEELISKFLKSINLIMSNDFASIDVKVGNAARITKLYGTVSKKGANTTERPHRESRIVKVPQEIKQTPIALIKLVADLLPEEEKPTYTNNYGANKFDLNAFIERNGIKVHSEINEGDYTKYLLSECVFDSHHNNKCSSLFQSKNGSIGYNCFHNGCSGKTWFDVVRKFEPTNPILFNKKEKPNYNKKDQIRQAVAPQQVIADKGEKFYRMAEIERLDRRNLITIPSGINEIDRRIVGFNKGEISVWSGNNGSGKSTILSQMSLHAATKGFKGIIYSGELKPQRVKDWLHLQAAGRQYVKEGKFEGSYFVPQNHSDLIDIWLSEYLFIYNNKYGNTFTQLLADIEEKVKQSEIDYIILDNLMSLDLDFEDNTQFEKQKRFIVSLADFARDYNVHIHLVAHPRKSTGFLRKTDISGSADLTNRPDNVFIVHRVNNDFSKSAGEFFDKKLVASIVDDFSNVIEICKNRDMGYMDELIGTYFEKESRRFLNTRYENPIYGWQIIERQQDINTQPNLRIKELEDNFYNTNKEPFGIVNAPKETPF